MNPLGTASSLVGIISVAISIQDVLFDKSFIVNRHTNFIKNDLPTLIAFLNDVKNSFLNSREQLPAAAESSMRSCEYYLENLESVFQAAFGPQMDQRMKVHHRIRIHFGHDRIQDSYRSFRDSVLMLKDVCQL
jgi:hypothetical protein